MARVEDAVILAGGSGTRMLPASLFIPKETMPLVDTPIINHLIWEVAKAGVSRVHLILSKRKQEILSDFISDEGIYGDEIRPELPRESLRLGLEGLEIIPHIQKSPGGVADAISTAMRSVEGPFLMHFLILVVGRTLGSKNLRRAPPQTLLQLIWHLQPLRDFSECGG